MRQLLLLGSTILSVTLSSAAFAQAPAARPHNVVLFVADGLRFRIVDDHTAPTMAALAREGGYPSSRIRSPPDWVRSQDNRFHDRCMLAVPQPGSRLHCTSKVSFGSKPEVTASQQK